MYVGRGLWWRLMQWALFLVLSLGAVTAHAYNISGTVSNTSGRTGRVYLSLQQNGFNTGLGISIAPSDPGWPNFTIRGVSNGSYSINAFVDGSGTGSIHPNDPTWNSPGSIAINNGDYAGGPNSTVSFTSHPTVLPVTPAGAMMMPGDNGTFVGWDEPKDNNGNKIADSYKVYWSTSKDTPFANPDGVITVPGGNQDFALLPIPNGSTVYVQVTAKVVGSPESAPTTVNSLQIGPPAGGVTVSGTVNLSGIANPAGNLYVAIVDRTSDKGGPVSVAFVTGSPQLSNNFTINGVPSGTYSIYALMDVNGDGHIGPGDIMISDQQAPMVVVGGSNVTNQTVTLTKNNSSSFLNTTHYQDSNTPPNDGYQVVLNTRGGVEMPVNVTLTGGPNNNGLTYPMDLGLNYDSFNTWLNVNGNRPQPTDVYHLSVQYASGVGPDLVDLPVTVVLDSFATPTAPIGNMAYPMPNQVLYSWNAPANPPAFFTYSFWTNTPGFNGNNNSYNNMPSSTSSVNLSGLAYSDGNRNDWTVTVQDAAGNQAQKSTWFTSTTGPAISSFTPLSAVPGTLLTVTGINFDPTAANNTVIFGCNQSATAQTATATQLTVVVPANACPSSIQVQESASGKISNFSTSMLNILPTIQVNGRVTDFVSGNNITGATVKVNSSILNNNNQQTTSGADPNNNYNFNNVPSGTNFTLKITAPGYDAAYSSTLNSNVPLSRNFALFGAGTVTSLNGGTAGLGAIRGRVVDQTVSGANNGIAGATVTASGGFTVVYANNDTNQTPNPSLTSTSANGVYYVVSLPDGTQVNTTASAAGYSFTPASVTGTAHADSVTFITNRGFPFISVTGTVTDLGTTPQNGQPLNGVAVNQLGSSNNGNSGPNGGFTLNGLAGGTPFELSLNQTGFAPVYTGPITSPTNVTLPYPLVMFTPSQLSALGIANGQGAIIGRVVSGANNAQPISGMQVNASRPGNPGYQVEYYDSSVNGFSPTATGTDSSGLFLVLNVDEGAQVNISAHNPFSTINGYLNLTTHGNAVSEVMVGCNVPQPSWGNLQNPPSVTTTTGSQTPNIYGQVQVPSLTNMFPGPADGLVAQLGYGPTGSAPNSPSWTWTPAAYDVSYNWGSQPGNYQYVAALNVSTAGSYDYAFRYSYYGGPFVYGDLQGMQNGNATLPQAGKLTVNAPIPVTVGVYSSASVSTYGQGVTFTATLSSQDFGTPTGTVQFQIDGVNFGAPVPTTNSWPIGANATSMWISNLPAGTHSVTAIYSGDAMYGGGSSAPFTQTVNKATPVINWSNPADITYGTPLGAAQLNATVPSVSGTMNYLPPPGTVLNAGTGQSLSVTFTPNDSANYTTANASVQINVQKAVSQFNTLTTSNPTPTYGQQVSFNISMASPAATGLMSFFIDGQPTGGQGIALVSGSATSAAVVLPVGSHNLTVIYSGDSNYNGNSWNFNGVVNVSRAPLTVTATSFSKQYGAAVPPLTFTMSGFVNGEDQTAVSGFPIETSSVSAGSAVGTYPINIGLGNLSASNYSFNFVNGTATVTPAPITVTANAQSKIYGAADPTLTYAVSGLVNNDGLGVFSGLLSRTPGQNVGTYAIQKGTLTAGGNYTITFTGANLSITPATLSVTANPQTKVYGSAEPALTYGVSGLTNSDTASVITGALTRAAGQNVGIYAIQQGNLTAGANYTIAYTGANLTVTPATLTVNAVDAGKIYGAALPTLTNVMSGFVNGDTQSVVSGAANETTTATAASGVGSYPISISLGTLAATNYVFTFTGATFTVSPATLNITANGLGKVYGAAEPTLTFGQSGLVNGDTVAVITGTLTRAAGSNVGNYAITQGSLSAGSNYTINYTGATFSIIPATLTITATPQTKVYGAADPPLSYTQSGLVNGDTASIIIGALSRAAGQNVGSYAIQQGSLAAGGNYSISFTGANLTVTPATLTVTAAAKSKVYGDADPALTYTFSGLVNGDSSAVVTGALSRTAGENVGSYPIQLNTLSAGTNYTISYTGATLTVTPATLTVTATPQSKVYGSADPALTYSQSGLVNGDTASVITGGFTRTAGEHAGSYPISQGTLTAGGNYTIAFTGANLTITKGQLAVAASSASKVYGAALPAFAYTVTGYVNGDTQAIVSGSPGLTTIATAASGVGSYPITITPGTLSTADYTFVFTNGTLTVTPATLTITANAQSKVFGNVDPALTYSQSGLVNGDTAALLTGALARQTGENVGSYGILQGTLSAGGNYSIAYSGASLTITKATPVVTWNNPAAIFVGTALGATQLSASASVPGTLVYTPAAGTVLPVGNGQTLSVTFTPSDLANYNVPGPKTVSIDVLPAGDLDGNGTVGLSDAVYYLQVALGAVPAPATVATPLLAPIVNGKPQPDPSRTKVNVLDVIAVLEKLVGKW